MRISNLVLASALLASTASAAQSDARAAFELAAPSFARGVSCDDVLYGRIDPCRWPQSGNAELAALLARHDSIEDLTALLKHDSSRVRTLAIVALYDREDPKLLPRIAELARDPARGETTGVAHAGISNRIVPPSELYEWSPAQWARNIVAYYMKCAGCTAESTPSAFESEFAEYWRVRRDRAFCAGWFLVRLERAQGGEFPDAAGSVERIRAVRADVDRLPTLDRALTLLWLMNHHGELNTQLRWINFDLSDPDDPAWSRNDAMHYERQLDGKFATEAESLDAARSATRS